MNIAMKRNHLVLFSLLTLVFVSCQKEIDWGTGTSGGSDGDLLVKAHQITIATNDTNVLTFQWDASKRLLKYTSAGKVNGTLTDITHTISRLSDGKIQRIVSKSSLTAGFLDSTVYIPVYETSSTRLKYVIDTQYTLLGPILDSCVYVYNGSGQVTSKETFSDFFGIVIPSGKETYVYDANGSITTISNYSFNGATYDLAATSTNTFSNHKSAVTLKEESFIILGAANASPKEVTKLVTNAVSSGTTYTNTFSAQQYNSNDRPKQASLSVMPQPPGYDMKLNYFYQ